MIYKGEYNPILSSILQPANFDEKNLSTDFIESLADEGKTIYTIDGGEERWLMYINSCPYEIICHRNSLDINDFVDDETIEKEIKDILCDDDDRVIFFKQKYRGKNFSLLFYWNPRSKSL